MYWLNSQYIFTYMWIISFLYIIKNIEKIYGKEDKAYINTLIKKLGISSQINKFPNELSGGQQQRVAIARALVNKSSIIFADEPTGNLDSKTTREVMDILKICVKEFNQTLVIITHNDEIAKTADRIITISDGKIVEANS